MEQSLKDALKEIGNNKSFWNKHLEIEGNQYVYISAKNEFRKVVEQPSGTVEVIVGCMFLGDFLEGESY